MKTPRIIINQLTGVTDLANATKGHKDNGNATDYSYYPDGSLRTDNNKGITDITYNYLGLPEEIKFGSTNKIKNLYTADGQKLAQLLIEGTDTTRTDYVGALIYKNEDPETVWTDEGRIKVDVDTTINSWLDTLTSIVHYDTLINFKSRYQYFIQDHLGNNRVIFEKLNDSLYVAQRMDYYPFGSPFEADSLDFRFTYQGKEYIDFLGLNQFDFHSRTYDSYLGRFNQVDGANQFSSGYTGMGNNPLNGVDPDGQVFFAIPHIGWSKKGGLSLGLEVGVGVPGALSASITGGYNFGSKSGYWSGQGYASGFYAGYGSQGGFGGWGYQYAGFSAGVSYGKEGLGVGLRYGGSSNNFNGAVNVGWTQKGGFDYGVNGGYTQKLGNEVSSFGLVLPAELAEPISPTDENLHNIMSTSEFGSDYMKKLAISQLTTEDFSSLPKGFNLKDGFLNDGKSQLGGITIRSGNKSKIFMSPGIFQFGEFSVFSNTGHEFVHAYHFSLGLSNISLSEARAYKWSSQISSSMSDYLNSAVYSQFSNMYLKNSGYKTIPAKYQNLPIWFPTKF